MGGKKKGAGKEGDVEDVSTKELLKEYKKSCVALETPIYKPLEKKIVEVMEEGDNKLPEILINERIGEKGAQALANALKVVK